MSTSTPELSAPVRWVGGKRSLREQIISHVPASINTYVEPFLGGGTIFLAVLHQGRAKRYVLNDINPHLINMWTHIRDNYQPLVESLHQLKDDYDALPDMDAKRERYYLFRDLFNSDDDLVAPLEKAALFMTLNKTAFNALVRYNGKGRFNSAFGKREVVAMEFENLERLHHSIAAAETVFTCGDFSHGCADGLGSGDFVYLDPPYHVLGERKVDDKTYSKEGFVDADELRLREFCDRLDTQGASFLMSNHECPEILEYFRGYPYERVACYKSFTGKASSRIETGELLLGNRLVQVEVAEEIGDLVDLDNLDVAGSVRNVERLVDGGDRRLGVELNGLIAGPADHEVGEIPAVSPSADAEEGILGLLDIGGTEDHAVGVTVRAVES